MLSLEDLERQIAELRTQNTSLTRRIADLEESIDVHVGVDYGAAQQLSPHPSQLISVAEYGGGVMRLDANGIQVANGSTDTSAIRFPGAFQESFPGTSTRYGGRVSGYGGSSAGSLAIGAYSHLANQTTSADYAQMSFESQSGFAELWWSLRTNSDGVSNRKMSLSLSDEVGLAIFELDRALLSLRQLAADPTATLQDGWMWYRTDTDRYRVRANGIIRNVTMDGTNTTLTIASGAVTATTAFHAIDTEAAAASDDLDTISGGQTGQILVIHAANDARTVVAKDGTGNLKLAGDATLDNSEDTLTLIYNGSNWLELARSNNGA